MTPHAAKKAAFADAGYVRISFRTLLPQVSGAEAVVASTGTLESMQEWHKMADAYYKDPAAGYRGAFLTIPQGVTVVTLRIDNIPGLEG